MSYSSELVRYINQCTERHWKVLKNNIYPSVYVHGTLLEWFKLELEILLRGIKYEISNIALEDNIYLVQLFYASEFKYAVHCNVLLSRLDYLMKPLKWCAKWIPKCNLFIPFDENYNQNLAILERTNLTSYLENTTDFNLNWFGISKIRLFEYNDRGHMEVEKVSKMLLFKYPLYICYASPWHQTWLIGSKHIPINTVCFDICVRVWRTYEHLKDFDIFDLLMLELANESNHYLIRFINVLVARQFERLKKKKFKIHDYRHTRINFDIFLYFIRRFHSKLKRIVLHEFCLDTPLDIYSVREIINELCIDFNVQVEYDKKLVLDRNNIKPDTIKNILRINDSIQKVDISTNYQYFTSDFFIYLLNCKVNGFEIHIDMSVQFEMTEPDAMQCNVNSTTIYLYNTGFNEIDPFLRFLYKVVFKCKGLELIIDDCTVEDYSIFNILFEPFDYITFKNFTPTLTQMRQVTPVSDRSKWLYFDNCDTLGDQHLLHLYENLNSLNIIVRGRHNCTHNYYFLTIEQIMRASGISTFVFRRPPLIEGFSLPPGEFEIRDSYLHIRDRFTGEFIDIFTFFNNKIDL